MMDNALNHAAVITWGWFNEGPSNDERACPAYGACNNYSRTRDPTRFTTWADDKDMGGKCYEHATLISFNNYPGWCVAARITRRELVLENVPKTSSFRSFLWFEFH
jgi:hypothetical protein